MLKYEINVAVCVVDPGNNILMRMFWYMAALTFRPSRMKTGDILCPSLPTMPSIMTLLGFLVLAANFVDLSTSFADPLATYWVLRLLMWQSTVKNFSSKKTMIVWCRFFSQFSRILDLESLFSLMQLVRRGTAHTALDINPMDFAALLTVDSEMLFCLAYAL